MADNVLSLLVENHQGVVARISGLLSGRGYNMESFSAGATHDPRLTRIILVFRGDDPLVNQVKKQLNKLIDVIKVVELTNLSTVDRELALIKISVKRGERGEVFQIADAFGARIMDVGLETMILELTGSPAKINDLVLLLRESIVDIARSGLVALERGKKSKTKIGRQENGGD